VAQLYPRALGSLSVASYDSQGYGGGIVTRLHTGLIVNQLTCPAFAQRHGSHKNIVPVAVYEPLPSKSRCTVTYLAIVNGSA
jgi:hypothetical protein